ncbi:hypothetical protein PB1_12734 [Bacillus methanolicus PB1]|uniref:Uncharacterized protein n=1 Tax=Bacillus methanolicus PB1 TaxID=997296 RepID=I3DW04_BACMT|nr:hypothetical protein PB1_12734 [Bacillus methanolicus PB1]
MVFQHLLKEVQSMKKGLILANKTCPKWTGKKI